MAVSFLALGVLAEAQTIAQLGGSRISPAEVDATVRRLVKAADVPGLGLAIINGDRVVYENGYGFREAEKKLPFTTDTVVWVRHLPRAFSCHAGSAR